MQQLLRLDPDDDVGVLPHPVVMDGAEIAAGHKIAVHDIAAGARVTKYGQVIGRASTRIGAGEHVHSHNLDMLDFERSVERVGAVEPVRALPPEDRATFRGIRRSNGRVATRNYLAVLPTVNCSATVARQIADYCNISGLVDDFANVDGVVALTHTTGCGMAADGEGLEVLRRTLRGYAQHPNVGALLVIGLGCEVNKISELTSTFDLPDSTPVASMTIQELGGTKRSVDHGVAQIRELLPQLDAAAPRTPVPASELVLGLNCGGSDGWSGITANPALGVASDLLVRQGATSVLAETPEIYGAEHLLTSRAVSDDVAERLVERIRWWEHYTREHGGTLDNNPSPGNKDGGLTTILEKSLGAVAKGGRSPLEAVYEYAQPIDRPGFAFMDTPGYDPVSVTGLIAGGANIVCFTTGRGSAFGARPVPSIKLATNSELYRRMADDMDLNCGTIADGDRNVDDVGADIFDLILRTAAGERTCSEELGYGAEEFVPWQLGTVM